MNNYNVQMLFPVCFHQYLFDEFDADGLIEFCYEQKEKDLDGQVKSNRGGWHSSFFNIKDDNIISDALSAKSTIDAEPESEKKLTLPAPVDSLTVSVIVLLAPNWKSPSTLKDLVLTLVKDRDSLLLYAPPISTLEILEEGVSGVVPIKMLLCSDAEPILIN